MTEPKVSVIIPVYNVEKYIKRCIDSLKKQTLEDIEIILVDDSSTDSSLEICRDLEKTDDRIIVLSKPNEGAGMARNKALSVARGKYIGFLDSDDYIESDMLKTLYEKAEEYNSDLVMSGVLFVDGNMFSEKGECVKKIYFHKDTQFETKEELKKLRMGIIGAEPDDIDDSKYGMSIWKNLFRREIIMENNLTFESEREIMSEDALFMIDYISHIKRATGLPYAFYNYCRNGNSLSKSYKKDRFEKSLVFVNEVEKRFKKDLEPQEYQVYIDRFWQAMCRVVCSQEIMHARDNKIKYKELVKRLKCVCINDRTEKTLKSYPLKKLPLSQRVFAYAMKYRLYFLLKVLVGLRSR